MQIYFIARLKLLGSAGSEPGFPLEAILQSKRSTTELAGPGFFRDLLLINHAKVPVITAIFAGLCQSDELRELNWEKGKRQKLPYLIVFHKKC